MAYLKIIGTFSVAALCIYSSHRLSSGRRSYNKLAASSNLEMSFVSSTTFTCQMAFKVSTFESTFTAPARCSTS